MFKYLDVYIKPMRKVHKKLEPRELDLVFLGYKCLICCSDDATQLGAKIFRFLDKE